MTSPRLPQTDDSVYDALASIRKHCGLHGPERSLCRVDAFLLGYECALRGRFEWRDLAHFKKFDAWVSQRYGLPASSYGWCRMILERAGNDEAAFAEFFVLLDEFRKDSP